MEKYLLNLPEKYAKLFCKFRTGNARLPIETGRWKDIPQEHRFCNLCNRNEIGDIGGSRGGFRGSEPPPLSSENFDKIG
jgi:hypothetical protein